MFRRGITAAVLILLFSGCTVFSIFTNNKVAVTVKNRTFSSIEFYIERGFDDISDGSIQQNRDTDLNLGIGSDTIAFVRFVVKEPFSDTIGEEISINNRYELTILGKDSYYWAFVPLNK